MVLDHFSRFLPALDFTLKKEFLELCDGRLVKSAKKEFAMIRVKVVRFLNSLALPEVEGWGP